MKKIFESANDEFLDVEKTIKEELNNKAVEKIENLEDEASEEIQNQK